MELSEKTVVIGILIIFLTSIAACGSSGGARYSEDSLEAHINRIDGVEVTGNGEFTKVLISPRKMSMARHDQGWSGKTEYDSRESVVHPPLFIVNDQKVGRDFQMIKDLVNDREIESTKLLSASSAFAQYNRESYYGVIEISTKSSGYEQYLKLLEEEKPA